MASREEIKVDIVSKYDERGADEAIKDAALIDNLSPTVDIDATGMEGLADAAGSLPGPLGQAAGFMTGPGGIAAGAGAGAVGLFKMAEAAADLAIDAKVTAELTGATVEDTSRLQAIWSRTGADTNDLNDLLLQMNGALAQSPEIAEQLGINLNDGANGVDRMLELVQKIDASTLSASEKAAIMSQAFGEEGVRQVQRLLVLFPELEQAMADVSDKQVMSEEDVENAREFSGQMAELKAQLTGLGTAIGKNVIPPFTEFVDMVNGGTEALDLYAMGMKVFDDAAKGFDQTQLEGLKTFEQVHAKVLELTDSMEIANRVATQWKESQDALNASLGSMFGGVLHPAAVTAAGIAEGATNAVNNVFLPAASPAVVVEKGDSFIRLNSMRTGP